MLINVRLCGSAWHGSQRCEKISFSGKFLPRNKKNLFFGSKMGVDLYTGSTYTWVNTVPTN